MSMISAQIDELRELAGDGSMEWVTGPIRASVLRDAADTIWQLRDDLQRTNAENAKLREMLAEDNEELAKMWRVIDYLYSFAKACGVDAGDMRELGIEVES